jgi:hypothetical protein
MRALVIIALCGACVVPDATFVVAEAPPVALTIDSRVPAAAATGVALDTAITIRFSAAVDARTVTATTVTLVDDAGVPVPAAVSSQGDDVVLQPGAPLRVLRSYTVKVAGVADEDGQRLAPDATWAFMTRDRIWSPSVEVSHGQGTDAREPRLAVHRLGYAFAAWHERDTSFPVRYGVWTSLYTPAGGWSVPLALSATDLADASAVSLSLGGTDDALIVWNQEGADPGAQVVARRYRGQAGWAPADVLRSALAPNVVPQVSVSAAEDGAAFALWSESTGVFARRLPPYGDHWEEPAQVSPSGPVRETQVRVDASGDAVAVWVLQDRVVSRRRRADEEWRDAAGAVHDSGVAQYQPRVALDGAGNATAVWLQIVDDRGRIMVADQSPDGTWTTPVRVDDDAGTGSTAPRLAVAAGGAALVVWNQYEAGHSNLWGRYRDAGGTWGPPSAIEGDLEWESAPASLAFDPEGRALVVWTQASGMLSRLWSRRFVPGAGWQPATEVAPNDLHAAGDAVLAFDRDGVGIAMWRAFDGLQYRIRASRFE